MGANWSNDARLTNDAGASNTPSINISGSSLHIVWSDNRDGNTEIYYKRNPSGNPIGIVPISTTIPDGYMLSQNYPNPFNPVTNIQFALPNAGYVKLAVYDMNGKEVAVLVNGQLAAGTYKADYNASSLSSGVYFYKLTAKDFTATKKMILIK